MKSELLSTLSASPLLALPLMALFLFVVVFVGILLVTMKKSAPLYDPVARLPLADDPPTHIHERGRR